MSDSVDAPKSKRGTHPNSLANLRAPWKPGESGNALGKMGPVITPALRLFADMTLEEIRAMDVMALTAGQAIARGMIIKAATDGAWGDKTREQIMSRLDGPVSDDKASAVAQATVVNIIRGGSNLGMEP